MSKADSRFHPAANVFPLLSSEEFAALVEDVRQHGVRQPIVRHQNGQVLDGRHRLLACEQLGIACPETTFAGDDSEVLQLIVSLNLHRRHLSASQRAMIAAELANLGKGRPEKTAQFCGVSQLRRRLPRRSTSHGDRSVIRPGSRAMACRSRRTR